VLVHLIKMGMRIVWCTSMLCSKTHLHCGITARAVPVASGNTAAAMPPLPAPDADAPAICTIVWIDTMQSQSLARTSSYDTGEQACSLLCIHLEVACAGNQVVICKLPGRVEQINSQEVICTMSIAQRLIAAPCRTHMSCSMCCHMSLASWHHSGAHAGNMTPHSYAQASYDTLHGTYCETHKCCGGIVWRRMHQHRVLTPLPHTTSPC
jgi:hypothetical protein